MPVRKPLLTFALLSAVLPLGAAQNPPSAPQKPQPAVTAPAPAAKAPDYSQEPFIVEKFHTNVRFENDGTQRRELDVRIKVQSEAGVQQMGQIAIGYSSANEKLTVDAVRVHKPDGSVVTAGAEAVQDLSAPIQREAPVYTDFRQKHVTVRGLRPGDTLEYRITTEVHTPLAPGHFWLEHNFIKNVIVLDETLTVDMPASRSPKVKTQPGHDPRVVETAGRKQLIWKSQRLEKDDDEGDDEKPRKRRNKKDEPPAVQLTTFQSWEEVAKWYAALESERVAPSDAIRAKAEELTRGRATELEKLHALYDYVAKNFRYVSLSFGVGRFQPHSAADVLSNQYGDCKDKHTLLASLASAAGLQASPVLIHSQRKLQPDLPSPSQFDHVISAVSLGSGETIWLDTTTEVAPFRLLSSNLRKKQALVVSGGASPGGALTETPADPPFESTQLVEISGTVSELGRLDAQVKYTLRGDNELPLRMAFRRTPRNQWKQLAQIVAASDGLRGEITEVKANDPASTEEPYQLEYRVSVPNYLEWSSKKSQLDLPLPGVGLPSADPEETEEPVELGTPLSVTTRMTLELPAKYAARAPVAMNVNRDYAQYRSTYKVEGQRVTAERNIAFKLRELPAARASDYMAFSRAVRSDENQKISIESTVAGTPTIPEAAKADELYEAGISAFRSGNYRTAIDLFKRVVEKEPKHKSGWLTLGGAHLSLREYDAAIAAFNKQVELNPYDERVYSNLGMAYTGLLKYEEALAAYRKQIEVNPLDRFAHAQLGMLLRERKMYADAVPQLERAITLNPENALLHVNLGQALLNTGEQDKAIAAFDKALEIAPSTTVYNNVAYELSLHNTHLDRAQQYAESAVAATAAELRNISLDRLTMQDVARVTSLAAYWDTLGWVYFQRGDLEKAEKFVRASWLLDFHGEVGDHLGQIYEKQGRKKEAADVYAWALSATRPDSETRPRLARLIGEAAAADLANKKTREGIAALRTVAVPNTAKLNGSAEFFVIISNGMDGTMTVDGARFITGDEKLRSMADALRAAKYHEEFPDAVPTKTLRRGILSCGVTGCSFVLLTPDSVTTLN